VNTLIENKTDKKKMLNTVKPPVNDRSNCYSASQNVLCSVGQHEAGNVTSVAHPGHGNPLGVDERKVVGNESKKRLSNIYKLNKVQLYLLSQLL
jgi:hypothetical protein